MKFKDLRKTLTENVKESVEVKKTSKGFEVHVSGKLLDTFKTEKEAEKTAKEAEGLLGS